MADRPQQPVRPARERKASPIKTGYLVLYNAVSTILWATILGRVLLVSSVHGTSYVFPAVGEFAKWTQTLALLEVVHAAVGEFGSSTLITTGLPTPKNTANTPFSRHRPRTPLHNPHASRQPHPPDLGHRLPFP